MTTITYTTTPKGKVVLHKEGTNFALTTEQIDELIILLGTIKENSTKQEVTENE